MTCQRDQNENVHNRGNVRNIADFQTFRRAAVWSESSNASNVCPAAACGAGEAPDPSEHACVQLYLMLLGGLVVPRT